MGAGSTIRIVDQDVDAAESVEERVEHTIHRRAVRDVSSEKFGLPIHGSNHFERLVTVSIVIQVVNADVATGFGQGQSYASSDAALAAGDKGLLAFKNVWVHVRPLLRVSIHENSQEGYEWITLNAWA